MPTFLPDPPLLNAALELASGTIYTKATVPFTSTAGLITGARAKGIVKAGVILTEDESGPFTIPVATAAAPIEVLLILDSWVDGRLQSVSWPRTVMVPDQATVTWADLIDVVPVTVSGGYAVPTWVSELLAAREASAVSAVDAAASAEAATSAAAGAAAAVADVPTLAVLTTTFVSRVQAQVSLDTDGVPYFSDATAFGSAIPILSDTDGVPYLAA